MNRKSRPDENIRNNDERRDEFPPLKERQRLKIRPSFNQRHPFKSFQLGAAREGARVNDGARIGGIRGGDWERTGGIEGRRNKRRGACCRVAVAGECMVAIRLGPWDEHRGKCAEERRAEEGSAEGRSAEEGSEEAGSTEEGSAEEATREGATHGREIAGSEGRGEALMRKVVRGWGKAGRRKGGKRGRRGGGKRGAERGGSNVEEWETMHVGLKVNPRRDARGSGRQRRTEQRRGWRKRHCRTRKGRRGRGNDNAGRWTRKEGGDGGGAGGRDGGSARPRVGEGGEAADGGGERGPGSTVDGAGTTRVRRRKRVVAHRMGS
ncbi:unnamed protein product [Closterium sp. NIES-54]